MDDLTTYLNQIGRYPLLSYEQEYALAVNAQAGDDDAAKELVNHNLRLVVHYAKRYDGVEGVEFLDLIQEGNLGLMRAVSKFDPSTGNRLSTYADSWIRDAMLSLVRRHQLPGTTSLKVSKAARKVETACDLIAQREGRLATADEVVEETGMSKARVAALLVLLDSKRQSLDAPLGTDEGDTLTLADLLADPNANVEGDVIENHTTDTIARALDNLSETERTVLVLRFGLFGQEPQTNEAIARKLGYANESAIRKTEARALGKLREAFPQLLDLLTN